MIVQPGAVAGDVEAVVIGEVEEAVWVEGVDGGIASSLEPYLSFCMDAAARMCLTMI